jgi:hypothetical protein
VNNCFAYIDESGDPLFGDKASETFLLCAVIFDSTNPSSISSLLTTLKSKYGITELKSNRIRTFGHRLNICRELVSLSPRIITIHVNKRDLYGDWFKYRASFYKYIQRLLNHELHQLFQPVSVRIDRYGSPQYQRSLREYLVQKLQKELFETDIIVSSVQNDDLIQASDFLAGSIRKALEDDSNESKPLIDLLKPFWIRRITLPDQGKHLGGIPDENSDALLNACMEEARRFLEKNDAAQNDPKIKTLEYLYYSAIDGSNEYIYSQEIVAWLETFGILLKEEQFRNEVIAALRDDGLIITGTRKGIKIPRTPEDIQDYIKFNVGMVLPVLRRLKKALTFLEARTQLKDINTRLSDEMQAILKEVNA